MPTYNKNFISQAIIRIDFEQPIEDFRIDINETINSTILRAFPLKESNDAFNEVIKYNALTGAMERERAVFKQWIYSRNDRTKKIVITKDSIYIEYNEYLNYLDFTTDFINILEVINTRYPNFMTKRLGVRYINHIKLESDINPLNWDEYINDNLLSSFRLAEENHNITRSIQILELNNSEHDIGIKFQYGMHNPDYPAVIRKKLFLLDFDGYKSGSLTLEELIYTIPLIHDEIELLFEKSISTELRALLNE